MKRFGKVLSSILFFCFILLRSTMSFADCGKIAAQFAQSPELKVCSNCHSPVNELSAPLWFSADPSEAALVLNATLSKSRDRADLLESNWILQKAISPAVPHGGGKFNSPAISKTLKAILAEFINSGCLKLQEITQETREQRATRTRMLSYHNLFAKIEYLTGENSLPLKELARFATRLGFPDYRVGASSQVPLNPETASILDRVLFLSCQDLAAKRRWFILNDKQWTLTLEEFMVENLALSLPEAQFEVRSFTNFWQGMSTAKRVLGSCMLVLRSERFLLP